MTSCPLSLQFLGPLCAHSDGWWPVRQPWQSTGLLPLIPTESSLPTMFNFYPSITERWYRKLILIQQIWGLIFVVSLLVSFSTLSHSFPPLSIDQSTDVYCTNNHLVFSLSVEGVPYNVRVFAENGVGNGTFCIITDFGNEGRKLACCYLFPNSFV